MRVLVTGGAGFIGSNTCVELLNNGFEVVVIDNFSNSDEQAIKDVEYLTGQEVTFYCEDVCNQVALERIFCTEKIDAVIHFAGWKTVEESVKQPLQYYRNNLISTLNLLEVMEKNNIRRLVFSSSAAVYGDSGLAPIGENFPRKAKSPYGSSKLMQENVLLDVAQADAAWNFALLRYFNPVGGHESGFLGENLRVDPSNLMPYIVQVAEGKLESLHIFGNDYQTLDGTGVRDYIHVTDLAKGHIAALKKMNDESGVHVYNFGTGRGCSVLELVETFSRVNQVAVPYTVVDRRVGDTAICYADTTKAERELGWKAEKNIEKMCQDAWNCRKR